MVVQMAQVLLEVLEAAGEIVLAVRVHQDKVTLVLIAVAVAVLVLQE
jgi:hypothetical protein